MSKPRYLTKSRFKKAIECPSKIFYTGKLEYEDQSESDSFLEALAEGGYQVGELAKCYFPNGTNINTLKTQEALDQTQELLKKDKVTIYEPAFLFENLLVRVDVLIKYGDNIELVEVKSKSFNNVNDFWGKKDLNGSWRPYLLDVAFQKYVLSNAHPEWNIKAFLMLPDKTTQATVDGLNQTFPIKINDHGRIEVEHSPLKDYGKPILTQQKVDEEVDHLWKQTYTIGDKHFDFQGYINTFSTAYENDTFLEDGIGGKCKGCEFKSQDKKSGFVECWQKMGGIDLSKNDAPLYFDLTGGRTGKYFDDGNIFLKELPLKDFEEPISGNLTGKNRRFLHVEKTKENNQELYFEKDRFNELKSKVQYPLHMIDFETTMVAIPFNKGLSPYEQIAFQFSHHTISSNGEIEHKTEWINTEKGAFPNFEFIRSLKSALEKDHGSIFRYSHHENTVLRQIHAQLYSSSESDKTVLMEFIDSITQVKNGSIGERNMIDLCDWVKKTYFDISTGGSSSLKLILPSILNRSKYLQGKYSKAIYGKEIYSRNFDDTALIEFDAHGNVINPYKLLPPVFEEVDEEALQTLWTNVANVAEGGAAMTAYAKMQFSELPEWERERITTSLLRYCELDTMAMVMLWEGLNDLATN